jgi:flagellar biosynthetic protein FliP
MSSTPKPRRWLRRVAGLLIPSLLATAASAAQGTAQPLKLSIDLSGGAGGIGDVSVTVQIVILMTLLTLAPSIIMLMTSFTRIVIVLGFVRQAIGVTSAPSNQIIIGLSLFLTFFIMTPVVDRIHDDALKPYFDGQIKSMEAFERAQAPLKEFMLRQTRTRDIEFFLELGGYGPTPVKQLPMRIVIPSFVLSELQTAFQMGFLIFCLCRRRFPGIHRPDGTGHDDDAAHHRGVCLQTAPVLLVDGWELVVRSLVQSFSV